MSDYWIREYRPADIPALTSLWRRVFGDGEELIAAFFRLLPGMGTGFAAEAECGLIGAAYLIDGLALVDADGAERRAAYLYAVAVEPSQRGKGAGAALSRAVLAAGKRRGAEIFCTQPAEPGLFAWYEKILGLSCALKREITRVPSAAGISALPLSPADYGKRRAALLTGRPHLSLSPAALEFQYALCRAYGGGFYQLGEAVAAAYVDGGRALIRELLAPQGTYRLSLAASLAEQLGAEEALLHTPAPDGEPYLSALPGSLPADCVWNLSFD